MVEGFGNETYNDVVAHQVATVHDVLDTETQRSALCHFVAEHLASGEMYEVEFFGQKGSLGTFAGTGGAKQDDVFHGCVLLDVEFLFHIGREGIFVDEDGDSLVAEVGFAGVEHAFVVAVVGSPAVFDHVVFIA